MEKLHAELKIGLSLLVLVVILGAIAWAVSFVTDEAMSSATAEEDTFTPGPPSAEIQAMIEKSKGFAVLVSYTNSGFEPSTFTIERGDTVRFVNNSSEDLWVASNAGTGAHYPGESSCGTSALDTCKPLSIRGFWEFTFGETGEWGFVNNLHKDRVGTAVVK